MFGKRMRQTALCCLAGLGGVVGQCVAPSSARADVVTDGEIESLVLANAPLTEDDFFLVPKVIE